jgi:hypothetical protein
MIKNFGRTPGHVVGGFCGWVRQPYDANGPDLSRVHSGSRLDAWPLVMPGEAVHYWLMCPSDSEFIEAMIAKSNEESKTNENIYGLVGEVDYVDAFNTYRIWSHLQRKRGTARSRTVHKRPQLRPPAYGCRDYVARL